MNTGKQYPLDTQGSYTYELKLFVFAKNINLYIENSNTTNKTKTLKSKLKKIKVAGYKINMQKSVVWAERDVEAEFACLTRAKSWVLF